MDAPLNPDLTDLTRPEPARAVELTSFSVRTARCDDVVRPTSSADVRALLSVAVEATRLITEMRLYRVAVFYGVCSYVKSERPEP
jgi:hypothetical protein